MPGQQTLTLDAHAAADLDDLLLRDPDGIGERVLEVIEESPPAHLAGCRLEIFLEQFEVLALVFPGNIAEIAKQDAGFVPGGIEQNDSDIGNRTAWRGILQNGKHALPAPIDQHRSHRFARFAARSFRSYRPRSARY